LKVKIFAHAYVLSRQHASILRSHHTNYCFPMKSILLFVALGICLAFSTQKPTPAAAVVQGTVKSDSGEAVIGASVALKKADSLIVGVMTDINGSFKMPVPIGGVYELEVRSAGYITERALEVRIPDTGSLTLHFVLKTNNTLTEVVVTKYEATVRPSETISDIVRPMTLEGDGRAGAVSKPRPESRTLTSDEIRSLPTRELGATMDVRAAKMKTKSSAVEKATTRSAKKAADAPRSDKSSVSPPPPPPPPTPSAPAEPSKEVLGTAEFMSVEGMDDAAYEAPKTEEAAPGAAPKKVSGPKAGQLTAGEWSDLHNWARHWTDLLSDGEIEPYQKMYGFYPRHRFTAMLANEQDVPLSDVVIQLRNAAGGLLWEARTDNTGKAELWAGLYAADTLFSEKCTLEALISGKKRVLGAAQKGLNRFTVPASCEASRNVDIVWAVDATGSMGDEIEYLKSELLDVIGRAKSLNPDLSYRMGTVFYRDKTDDYITKSSGLSYEIAKTVDFIRDQSAGGGGDYPEAVHSALEEAIFKQRWSENAVARICFLVLDASPHQGADINASLQRSITEAARRGIRIVPITASGIQKDTEFLMKFFGLATNGSYVFLTDHSGIGGKHLAPTTDEYKVELLNDLLVRLIMEYTNTESCDGKSSIRFENDPQQPVSSQWTATYYPNPAIDRFTLELPVVVESVTLYDAEGKAVRKIENPVVGANNVQVQDLPGGFYTIRILSNGKMQSGKLMVVKP
jgi:hypothetical protein